MAFKLLIVVFCINNKIHAQLFPTHIDQEELFLPNVWSSVRDCPVRYYDAGREGVMAPVGGQKVYEREFAHMAVIGWTDESGKINWNCGGSLINENFIVTAGHCTVWQGNPPDVVRMGDINLENDADDQHAQQISIEKIILHPLYDVRFKYNDIALIKLNSSINLTETVCPACLWINDTVQFHFLEACGFGQIGYLENRTPKLLKVTLSPVNYTECSDYYPPDRRLRQGLKDHQICATDRNGIMDTCFGDSGGPLQIKLLGNARMHPFLIGITSFGNSCGTKTPGVYTRIASFVDWIVSVTEIDVNPRKCALKYAQFREWEPDVITSKNDERQLLDLTQVHFITNTFDHDYLVQIGWKRKKQRVIWACTGILITEKFVVTLASCLRKRPDIIKTRNEDEIDVKSIILHPQFEGIDNDIALVEVMTDIRFSDDVRPACLYSKPQLPETIELNLLGLGSIQNIVENYYGEYDENEVKTLVTARSSSINYTYCNKFYQNDGIRIDDETKICYGDPDYYLVPDTCEIAMGAPLTREIYASQKYFSYIMGLPVLAHDCGFGYPSVATKVSHYIDWIDSVLFPNKTRIESVVPKPYQIEKCPEIYRQYRKSAERRKLDQFSHLALIGYGLTWTWYCRGNLISDRHVLTSYECFNNRSDYDTVALGNINSVLYKIVKVSFHKKLLTLITLEKTVSFSNSIVPICLWLDGTKIPFKDLAIVSKINGPLLTSRVRPYQTSECRKMSVAKSIRSDDQSCISFYDILCTSSGTAVHAVRNETGVIIPYLVGQLFDVGKVMCDAKNSCNEVVDLDEVEEHDLVQNDETAEDYDEPTEENTEEYEVTTEENTEEYEVTTDESMDENIEEEANEVDIDTDNPCVKYHASSTEVSRPAAPDQWMERLNALKQKVNMASKGTSEQMTNPMVDNKIADKNLNMNQFQTAKPA